MSSMCNGASTKLAAAVEEFLRYDAPVPHSTFRYAIEPVALGGGTIPAGAQVIISLAAANRDAGDGELAGGWTSAAGLVEWLAGSSRRIDQRKASSCGWREKAIEDASRCEASLFLQGT